MLPLSLRLVGTSCLSLECLLPTDPPRRLETFLYLQKPHLSSMGETVDLLFELLAFIQCAW